MSDTRRRGWWIAGAVTAVLVVAAGVVFVVMSGRSGGPVAVTPSSPPAPSPSSGSPADVMTVQVYFHQGEADDPGRVVAVPRTVPRSEMVATAALGQLLGGPTADESGRGYWSVFVPATADSLRGVRVTDGVAYADFRNFSVTIPNASSSFGGAALLAELDATLKQFATVKSTVYSFDGDVAAFYHWLQLEPSTGDTAPAIAAARQFLTGVVGMDRPADGPFRWVGDGIAEATFYSRSPNNDEPVVGAPTVVALQRGAAGSWEVTGTRADVIQVDTPTSMQEVISPLRVAGRAHTFEGNVVVRVLADQGGNAVEVGNGFVTGGGDVLRPFSGDITFAPRNPGAGWVLFTEPSAADRRIILVTSIRIAF